MSLVSVIIPTHNYGQYISDALESVFSQTYRNIEVIVVDDGSTDNTRAIVEKYANVRYFFQEHIGHPTPARAINTGIKLSKGEYIVVLAADDRIRPRYIERCLGIVQTNPKVGLVWTGSLYFGSDTKRLIGSVMPITKNPIALSSPFTKLNGAIGSGLIPKRVYDVVGLYDENLISAEDVDMCIRILMHHWKARGICELLHEYRMHELNDTRPLKRLGLEQLYRKYPLMRPFRTLNGFSIRVYRFFRHPKYTARKVQQKLYVRINQASSNSPNVSM